MNETLDCQKIQAVTSTATLMNANVENLVVPPPSTDLSSLTYEKGLVSQGNSHGDSKEVILFSREIVNGIQSPSEDNPKN